MAPKKRTTRESPATTTTTTTPVTNAQLTALIDQGVADALAARDADRSMNGNDSHNSGTGVRRQAPLARECTYLDFMKCKPLYFKGTKGVVELTQWFERIETVFRISNCTVENQIKFTTCTLLESALTWWNAHVRTLRGEIKKLEVEMWNLKVKGTDVVGYNQRFQELVLMCARMFPEESDKIEKFFSGLPYMVHGSISTHTERQAKNKRKLDNNNQAQQQPPKNQGMAIAYIVGPGERKETLAATNNQRNLTCYECGNQGHYMSDCPKLKNQNYENQAGGTRAHGMVHALGGGEINQDLNNIEDDINA
ncbi:hypothetical protein Tco_0216426 [Tanacetum coccineum]